MGLTGKNRWMLSGAMIALSLAGLHPAEAQEAEPSTESLETVVITGSRQIVSTPEQIKRSNTGIVDSITQNEIDTLPDQTLPEVLDRLPGVSSDIGYNTSKAQYATIRGFDSRYDSAEVDGNPIWNSSRNNRGAQLDIFPAGAVSQVNVYKTVTPDQDANSIGGHIELRTLRAFDGGDGAYLNMRGEAGFYNQGRVLNGKSPSYMFSAVGKDTFGDNNQYGFVLGVSATRDSWDDKYATATPFSQIKNIDVVNGDIFPSNYDNTIDHYGAYAKLEAHATDKFYAFLSAAFFEALENNQEYRTGPYLTASAVTSAAPGSGSFTKVPDESYLETYMFRRKEVLLGSGLDYRVNDTDQINVRLGWTNYSDYEDDATGEKFEGPAVSGSYLLGGDGPDVTLSPNSTTGDPANWAYRNKNASSAKILPLNDNVYTATLGYNSNDNDGSQGFGYKVGGGFRRLNRNFNQTQLNYTLPKGVTANLGQFVPAGTSVNGGQTVFIDPGEFWSFIQSNGTLSVNPSQTADYRLVEDVYTGYAEAVYGWNRFHGLAGLRLEATQSTDRTSNQQGSAIVPETYKVDYTNVMPNVQLQYDATERLRLRAAYTQTIARPDFKDYAMGQTVGSDVNGFPVISGTNPYLKPRVSYNYDLSAEYYGGDFFASAGAFHKTIKKDEFSQKFQQTNDAGQVIETETIPLNTGSAYLDGFELNYVQYHADWLPQPLDGLHWNANYTRLIGEWDVNLSDGSPRRVGGLRNQPTWLGNLGVGYKWGPLDLNVAVRFRGRTFTGSFGVNSLGDVWYNSYTRVDLQASYKIMPGLQAFADMRNLNNAEFTQYTGQNNSLTTWIGSGPSFFFGLKFKPDLAD